MQKWIRYFAYVNGFNNIEEIEENLTCVLNEDFYKHPICLLTNILIY